MPPIVILPLMLAQAAAPPSYEGIPVPPPPAPPVIYTVSPPAPPPPAPRSGERAPTPRGNPGNWANSNDYPPRALRGEQEGTTAFRVIVNANGRVTHCEVRSSSGWPSLDQETCRMITRRARFNPATNSRGDRVEGAWSSAVRWQIPKDAELIWAGASGRQFVIEADGTMSQCRQRETGTIAPGYMTTCNAAQFYEPFRDKRGKPAARQVTITTVTSIADVE
jgi:TonB family protein